MTQWQRIGLFIFILNAIGFWTTTHISSEIFCLVGFLIGGIVFIWGEDKK